MGCAGGCLLLLGFPPFFSPFAIGIVLSSARRRGERKEGGKKAGQACDFFLILIFSAQKKNPTAWKALSFCSWNEPSVAAARGEERRGEEGWLVPPGGCL